MFETSSLYRRQKTLRESASFSGVGLHTGHEVTMTFFPAEEDTGIIFERCDLPGRPTVPAFIEHVQDTSRSTTLGIGQVRLHTVEHVLAALHAYQIDNVRIEISAPEPPIGDGSSLPFMEMIEAAGVVQQEKTRPILQLKEPVYYSHGDIHLVALPSNEYRISYTLHYPNISAIRSQYFSLPITLENFRTQLANCRTFSLYDEVSMLIELGLIKGGSLENAVVIKDDVIFSKDGLKFPDEMVRHKILDLVGDLALVGAPFHAHIIAIRSGHAANTAFCRKLLHALNERPL